MKRAIQLLKGSEESYNKLTELAAPEDLQAWQEGELKSTMKSGNKCQEYGLLCTKAKMQLQLSWEQPAGKLSTIEFLSEGISIQESQ
jgi:hypothetical protein